MPFRKLFLSRWSALFWAGGIIWSAVDFVGVQPAATTNNQAAPVTTDATGMAVQKADLDVLANAFGDK